MYVDCKICSIGDFDEAKKIINFMIPIGIFRSEKGFSLQDLIKFYTYDYKRV